MFHILLFCCLSAGSIFPSSSPNLSILFCFSVKAHIKETSARTHTHKPPQILVQDFVLLTFLPTKLITVCRIKMCLTGIIRVGLSATASGLLISSTAELRTKDPQVLISFSGGITGVCGCLLPDLSCT